MGNIAVKEDEQIGILYNKYWHSRIYGLYYKPEKRIIYVGSTFRKNRDRLKSHFVDAKQGSMRKIPEFIRKNGKDNIEIKTLEYYKCNDENELLRREQMWINYLGTPECNDKIACFTEYYGLEFKYMYSEMHDDVKCCCGAVVKRVYMSEHAESEKHKYLIKIKNAIFNNPKLTAIEFTKSNDACENCFVIFNANKNRKSHMESNKHIDFSKLISLWREEASKPKFEKVELKMETDESSEYYSQIYMLVSKKDRSKKYVGRTKLGINRRVNLHGVSATASKKGIVNVKKYMETTLNKYINEVGGIKNFDVYILEDTKVSDVFELSKIEQKYMDIINPCLNKYDAYIDYKNTKSTTNGETKENHKKIYKSKITECECGHNLTLGYISGHRKSELHKDMMAIKSKILNGTDEKIEKFKLLENDKYMCECYVIRTSKKSLVEHIKTEAHKKTMSCINKFREIRKKDEEKKSKIQLKEKMFNNTKNMIINSNLTKSIML